MTYQEFKENFLPELLKIKSFKGKMDYANQYLQRIGSGTGRIVYDIDGEKILKLAKNPKGIAQNETEAGAGYYRDTQNIVTIVYDSADDDSWLISEKAKKVNEARIIQLTGIPNLNEFWHYVKNYQSEINGRGEIFHQDPEMKQQLIDNEWVQEIVEFIANYAQQPGDYGRPSTFGEVLRDGQPTIVLTDYGLNDEVYDTHYNPRRKQGYHMYELFTMGDVDNDILGNMPAQDAVDTRGGMWALMPYGVGDGPGVINEDFISFVLDRDKYPTRDLPSAPYLVDEFHECINNLKEVLNHVDNKKKFYGNLLELQDYLIRRKFFDREPLQKEMVNLNENAELDEGVSRENADKIANVVAEKYYNAIPKYIGEGTFGVAYDIGNNMVLKVTGDRSEANENLMLVGKHMKHIAEPYKVFSIKSQSIKTTTDEDDVYVIILEKLTTNPTEFKATRDRMDFAFDKIMGVKFSDVVDHYVYKQDYDGVDEEKVEKYMARNPKDAQYLKDILKIAQEAKDLGIESMDYLNPSNLGYKPDGTLAFFDVGFGNYFFKADKQPEEIQVDEDATSKFSSDDSIGRDNFPIYNQHDTSPLTDNNIPTTVDEDLEYHHVDDATKDEYELDERVKSYMPGSQSVEVKKKCRLGGLGNTSAACNQGDIRNLNLKAIDETINVNLPSGDIDGYGTYDILNNGQVVGEMGIMDRDVQGGNRYVALDKIFIDKEFRGKGYASDAMRILFDYADKNNVIITLTPDNLWGANKEKLRKWYQSLGFVMNKGRNKDFQTMQLMYRLPARMNNLNEVDEANLQSFALDNQIEKDVATHDLDKVLIRVYKDADDTISVYTVNGDEVRDSGFIEWVDGGNHWVDADLPEDEQKYARHIGKDIIWIDNVFIKKPIDFEGILLHERTESFVIKHFGYTYDNAHVIANKIELMFRKRAVRENITNDEDAESLASLIYTAFKKDFKKKHPRTYKKIQNENNDLIKNPIFTENNIMNEAEIISLQDLPFKKEVEQLGGKIYSVGGAVRDEFLGMQSKDLDVLITGIPMDKLEQILSKYGKVDVVGKSFGILKFKPQGATEQIDIAIPRTEKPTGGGGHKDFYVSSDHVLPIEKDLERRDFTINAIARDVEGNLIDPLGGTEDLKNKIIRVANPKAFSDDPLRMLRAVQFASRFNFTIEPETMKMIQDNADRFKKIAPEKILIEFDKIIKKGNILTGAVLLDETGLFTQIFGKPQYYDFRDTKQPFDKVKSMAEFIYLLSKGVVERPAEFYKTKLKGNINTFKEIKALELALGEGDINNPVMARSIVHNMYLYSPQALQSQIIPKPLQVAAQELLQGKYPKTINELAVNGDDLMTLGLKDKEIGNMQKSLLLKVYADKVRNNREELLNLAKQNSGVIEGVADKYAEKAFNIPDPSVEQDIQAKGVMQTGIEEPAGYVKKTPIFENPKSLANFDRNTRAFADLDGNLFVAQKNGSFNHGDMAQALDFFQYDEGIYDDLYEYQLLHRIGIENAFGLADTSADFATDKFEEDNMKYVNKILRAAKLKNPQYDFYPEYFYYIKGKPVSLNELIYPEFHPSEQKSTWNVNGQIVDVNFFVDQYYQWNQGRYDVTTTKSVQEFLDNNFEDFSNDEKLKHDLFHKLVDNEILDESKSKYTDAKKSLMMSKSISEEMKKEILKYIGGGSTYKEGGYVHGLIKPKELLDKTPKAEGVSMGADKDGFFVYTHRQRSKSYASPEKISIKDIEFTESTG
jgi:tRNA nucleotidyltransferase/poly(A) polymerase/GNAT superfamily N-acetyltransferase